LAVQPHQSNVSLVEQAHAAMRGEDELMAAYIAGEEQAFDELFRRYAPALLRALSRTVSPADAGDIVQQTFLQLHRCRNDFKPGLGVRPWIYTIAYNLLRKHAKKRGRANEVLVDSVPAVQPAVESWEAIDLAHQVRSALAELPFDQQRVIALHWFEGLPYDRIAETMGASLSAVKVRAHRGYLALRKIFDTRCCSDCGGRWLHCSIRSAGR
jgi:RNA polymerase sigma-70 factor (ECF subfamily)